MQRIEDDRLLSGNGQYIDDLMLPDQGQMVVLRSPSAHAKIGTLDVGEARQASGVRLVLTADDLANHNISPLHARASVDDISGEPMREPPRPLLADGKVVFVGQPMAIVVADSLTQALDAIELIEFDTDDLPVVDNASTASNAAPIWDQAPDNRAFTWQAGNPDKVSAAFKEADHVVELTVAHPRINIAPVETRGCLATVDTKTGQHELHTPSQGVMSLRAALSECLGIEATKLRVITGDVGGSFAVKIWPYPEQALALLAARLTGRPVKWVGTRSESFSGDAMGRGRSDRVRLALNKEGRFLGLSLHSTADMGAFLNTAAPMIVTDASMRTFGHSYDIDATLFTVDAMFTNRVPTDAYRGAGKPESVSSVERLIDVAAQELDIDPLDLRERNLIRPDQIPYTTGVGVTYDAGDFPALAQSIRSAADVNSVTARKELSSRHGLLRGFGLGFYVHVTGGSPEERSEVRALPDGTVLVRTGTQDSGQGHRTALAMVAAEALDLPLESIRVEQGDSDWLDKGGGTGGSNLMTIGGNTVHRTAVQMLEQARHVASELLEAAPGDIEYKAGRFAIAGTDRQITLAEVAAGFEQIPDDSRSEPMGAGCAAQLDFDGIHATAPNGVYACEVELDPRTGAVRIDRFTGIDDLGRVINEQTVLGQLHGGIGQAAGEVLMESMQYDIAAQVLSGSLMDYALPRADDLPMMQMTQQATPSPNSVLGVKGVGEVSAIGAPGAIMNAVHDALRGHGIRHLDIPLTPQKIWQALNS